MTLSNDIQTVESRCATTKQNPDILDNLDIMTSIHLRCSSPREFLRMLVAKERFLPADPLLNNWTFFRIANESWRTPKCPATGRVRCKLFGRKIQEDEEQQLSSSSRILRCQLVYFGALEVVRHMVTCFVMFWHCEWFHISTPPSNQQSDQTRLFTFVHPLTPRVAFLTFTTKQNWRDQILCSPSLASNELQISKRPSDRFVDHMGEFLMADHQWNRPRSRRGTWARHI